MSKNIHLIIIIKIARKKFFFISYNYNKKKKRLGKNHRFMVQITFNSSNGNHWKCECFSQQQQKKKKKRKKRSSIWNVAGRRNLITGLPPPLRLQSVLSGFLEIYFHNCFITIACHPDSSNTAKIMKVKPFLMIGRRKYFISWSESYMGKSLHRTWDLGL